MSAIWGIISNNISENNLTLQIDAMSAIYENRCKLDKINHIKENDIAFCCGLQFITKESENETLPYYDKERDIFFTADCLLDNRTELIKKLSIKDTEICDGMIIYKAFLKYGIDCLKYLEGLFSIAIYDNKKKTFYLAADKLSQRSIYYYVNDGNIYFSTLIDPVLQANPNLKINENYLKDFLLAPGMMPNIVAGETPYDNIFQIIASSYIKIENEEVSKVKYFNILDNISISNIRNEKEVAKRFVKVYSDCVKSALRCQKEVAISLSSGLDSSSVAALSSLELSRKNKKLFSFTYVNYEKPPLNRKNYFINDETDLVKKLIELYPNIIPEFVNNEGKNSILEIPEILKIMEIPFKATVNLPNLYEIYKKAYEKNCRIVLTGQFGNSTVSYGDIQNVLYDLYTNKKYIKFLKCLNGYCTNVVPQSRKRALLDTIKHFTNIKRKSTIDIDTNNLTDNPLLAKDIHKNYSIIDRFGDTDFIQKLSGLPEDHISYQSNLTLPASYAYIGSYETKLGLACGIVVRDPTRDIRLQKFCLSLPFHFFAFNGNVRWLIRGAMHDFLPKEYVDVWPRYGLQNADWHIRIIRDWKKIREKYYDLFTNPKMDKYIDQASCNDLLEFLDNVSIKDLYEIDKFSAIDESKLQYLSFVIVLYEFLP
ncbi:asparagine synthase (glutamine-hydrolysing) [Acetitomaculum ruminis DSM 5522]|uniref:asparagine synthase (glutamine-hydrolyzing) n=1 Tax=Acetitomaculum ruminis DSM 5522 TaxID=1120918 RepID=A0A1I0ZDE5_9FIRM|nr:asparagine synthase-related protein [Acetitomaculum ruminis]SFB23136.1 asparagine synthase (glutamine-hydrolysing) [Acetitomaculum ruminis DSM 5522]